MKIEIKDVNLENIDDFINVCIPFNKKLDPLFKEGFEKKKLWINKVLESEKSLGKIAYVNNEPKGIIQYLYRSEENVLEILCIFVSDENFLRMGIGKKLLFSLFEYINDKNFPYRKPFAIINYPIDIPNRFPQSEFFKRYGFKELDIDGQKLVYFPLIENYIYKPEIKTYKPQKEDENKVLIFYNPSCPFCIYFAEKIKEIILEIDSKIEIRFINIFEEKGEVEKRGIVYDCIVNKIPIKSFFSDRENFKKEVFEALNKKDNLCL